MSNIVEYKGYQAIIEYSAKDATLFGKVMDIDDRIIFEIENPSKTEEVFKSVIEDYLEMCKEVSKEPCKPYKGSFNVRISPELHKKAVQEARKKQKSLNAFIELAIKYYFLEKSNSDLITEKQGMTIIINQSYKGLNSNSISENSNIAFKAEASERSGYNWQYKIQ